MRRLAITLPTSLKATGVTPLFPNSKHFITHHFHSPTPRIGNTNQPSHDQHTSSAPKDTTNPNTVSTQWEALTTPPTNKKEAQTTSLSIPPFHPLSTSNQPQPNASNKPRTWRIARLNASNRCAEKSKTRKECTTSMCDTGICRTKTKAKARSQTEEGVEPRHPCQTPTGKGRYPNGTINGLYLDPLPSGNKIRHNPLAKPMTTPHG
ncbi:uncharacterized protein ARMOST_10379 [Armillaria ostoyae]|uniref:Uncharacterized protein n=1 Tax=Armillaria ostoyae TaxID=47428 RepID=A0A284RE56_ARMOS|nr:uncharacterized protein ARMOST_10379 [Armillaria ostoyae]